MRMSFSAATLVVVLASWLPAYGQGEKPPRIDAVGYTISKYIGDPDWAYDEAFEYWFDFFGVYYAQFFWGTPAPFDPAVDVAGELDLITVSLVVVDDDLVDPNSDTLKFFYRVLAIGSVGPPEAPALIGGTNAKYEQLFQPPPWDPPPDNAVLMTIPLWIPRILGANADRLRGLQNWDVDWTVEIRVANTETAEDGDWDSWVFSLAAIESAAFSPLNPPPVADAGPDQTVTVGSTVRLDGHLSFDSSNLGFDPTDPNVLQRDIMHYVWEQISGPETVAIEPDPTQPAESPFALAKLDTITTAGTPYVFRLAVDDSVNTPPSTDEVQIFVVQSLPDNRAPQAVISNADGQIVSRAVVNVSVGQQVKLSAALSSDPDGNSVSYRWRQTNELGGALAADEVAAEFQPLLGADTQEINWTATQAGTYYFHLLVTDNPPAGLKSLTATEKVTLVVSEAVSGSQATRAAGKDSTTTPDTGEAATDTAAGVSAGGPLACGSGSLVPLALLPAAFWLMRGRRR